MANRGENAPNRFEWERAVRDSDIPAPSKLIALTLGTHTGNKCRRPFVSIATLVQETSLGRRTVVRHLKLLTQEDGRFVQKRERMDKDGRQTSNEYQLTIPTSNKGVQEIHPGVPNMHPRGGHSDTGEGASDAPEGSKKEGRRRKDSRGGSCDLPRPSDLVKDDSGNYVYPPAFEGIWTAYPARNGANLKEGAYRKWRTQVRNGAEPDELYEATAALARRMDAEGTTGSRYVMQATKFFGPDEYWREELEAGAPPIVDPSRSRHDALGAIDQGGRSE